MATSARRVVGVVLAGGASRRFGSDKLAAPFAGRPLVLHAVDAVLGVVGVEEVVVVGPASPVAPAWLEAVAGRGATIVRDDEPFGGPLAGLAVALDTLRDADVAIVVGGDMPRLDPVALGYLVRQTERAPGVDIAFLASESTRYPLPLAVSVGPGRSVAHDLLGRGERSLRSYLEEFGQRFGWTGFDPHTLVDVDTLDDLHALQT